MFTATRDLLLPTTVTGSWPRPRWFTGQLQGRMLSTCLKDTAFREQLFDAFSAVVADQTRAGLDIVTHGDYFQDDTLGGQSWLLYPLERWRGLEGDYPARVEPAGELSREFAAGSILGEVLSGWRWPKVVGKIEANPAAPLEYAKIWRIVQGRTSLPVKFGTVSAQGMEHVLEIETREYDPDDRRQFIWDMATVMNHELRELVQAGCRVIQIEEPVLHFLACFSPDEVELIDFFVDVFNHEVAGLEQAEIWVHTCWGNPNMQRVHEGTSYANAMEIYLDRLNADVWTIELKDGGTEQLKLFKPYTDKLRKKVAIGVVSHRNLQVETPEEVATLARAALEYIDPEHLILSSDCGFGRQGANRLIAFYKAVAIAKGANIVRRELGAAERNIPAADPTYQIDG